MKKTITLFILIFLLHYASEANNISVSNTQLTGQNTIKHTYQVKFDLSWENSWSNGTYWDAAWVFVKYRANGGPWRHATLNWENGQGASDGHSVPSNSIIHSSNDDGLGGAHGVIVCPSSIMTAPTVNYNNIELKWNYGVDNNLDTDSFDICVFAIEMVYVPEGSFFLGDGDGVQESSYSFHPRVSNNSAIQITNTLTDEIEVDWSSTSNDNVNDDYLNLRGSQYQLKIDGDSGVFIYSNYGNSSAGSYTNFPTGYKGFYMMKYEVSQQQYCNFLNKIGISHVSNRMHNASQNRFSISGTYPNLTPLAPARAMNMLSVQDVFSYLDWTALRPMTELEYEKAARGPSFPLVYEYAWGDDNISTGTYTVTNDGLPNATVNGQAVSGNALYNQYGVNSGPYRCGIFPASAPNGGRIEAGSSYYGIMELSGNLTELAIGINNGTQRNFQGNHGDGRLGGSATYNTGWPTTYIRARGGSFQHSVSSLRTSSRTDYYTNYTTRYPNLGIRGVRSDVVLGP